MGKCGKVMGKSVLIIGCHVCVQVCFLSSASLEKLLLFLQSFILGRLENSDVIWKECDSLVARISSA